MPFPEVDKLPDNVYAASDLSTEELFADSFSKLGGRFVFCANEQELLEQVNALYDVKGWAQLFCAEPRLMQLFRNNRISVVEDVDITNSTADACITACECLVARTGSILLSSKQNMGRTSTVFYPVHIVVAYADQLVPDIQQSFEYIRKKYGEALPSMINLNTGPSRTADIEKTLVVGVHGPGEVYCFYVNA